MKVSLRQAAGAAMSSRGPFLQAGKGFNPHCRFIKQLQSGLALSRAFVQGRKYVTIQGDPSVEAGMRLISVLNV